jgi:hypothetical protein
MTDPILFGWNDALDMPSAVSLAREIWVRQLHVLISTVDSSSRVRQMPSLVPLLQRLEADYEALGAAVVVGGGTFLTLVDDGFFNGFDEVWLFNASPREPKPEAIPLTSDIPLREAPSDTLVSWMHSNGGIAGLADGIGLNFATFDSDLARLWSA